MQEIKTFTSQFDIHSIMSDVEKVIQEGLNKLLVNYIERHELLEKTHQQLMKLPSIANELQSRQQNWNADSESNSEDNTENYDGNDFVSSIKDMTENIVREHVVCLENKLNKMEKKYDAIVPILDKLLGKITHLNYDIKELQNRNKNNEEVVYRDTIEKSSVVKSCENENIEIHIEEEISDDEDVNPALITCSVINLNQNTDETNNDDSEKENIDSEKAVIEEEFEEEIYDELSVGEELGEHETPCTKEEQNIESEKEVKEESEEDVQEASVETETKEEESEDVEEESEEDVEEASVETETKEEESEDEEEEIFEIDIDDTTYCTNNDENGFIWELTEDGEQGEKVGYFKGGEPFFYAEEN